ncbi:MAG: hypothetical protein KKB31_01495 [Nanoarchaeota archaeon]|nr:hypothetical protein [Nanoarchaeota archaeon]
MGSSLKFIGTVLGGSTGLVAVVSGLCFGLMGIGGGIERGSGSMTGVFNRVEETGVIWKTKEATLALEGKSSSGDDTNAGSRRFSSDSHAEHGEDIDSLYVLLQKYQTEDRKVRVDYIKTLTKVTPWRGKTGYLIQGVTPIGD